MVPNRSKKSIERHRQKKILRRLQKAQQKIQFRRQRITDLIAAHLANTENDWQSLPNRLQTIAQNCSVEGLFSQKQRDKLNFKKDEPAGQKVTREAVGPRKGQFHVAFFALAPGFRGKPHAHAGVNCVSAVLGGPFTEILYSEKKDGTLVAESKENRAKGSVVADLSSANEFIHSVGNYGDDEVAYSMHVYSVRRGTNFNKYYDEKDVVPPVSPRRTI